jgi:hypothetical protein
MSTEGRLPDFLLDLERADDKSPDVDRIRELQGNTVLFPTAASPPDTKSDGGLRKSIMAPNPREAPSTQHNKG